jgi:hypothetical protein
LTSAKYAREIRMSELFENHLFSFYQRSHPCAILAIAFAPGTKPLRWASAPQISQQLGDSLESTAKLILSIPAQKRSIPAATNSKARLELLRETVIRNNRSSPQQRSRSKE